MAHKSRELKNKILACNKNERSRKFASHLDYRSNFILDLLATRKAAEKLLHDWFNCGGIWLWISSVDVEKSHG